VTPTGEVAQAFGPPPARRVHRGSGGEKPAATNGYRA